MSDFSHLFLLLPVQPVVWLSVLPGTSITGLLFFGQEGLVGGVGILGPVICAFNHSHTQFKTILVRLCVKTPEGAQECLRE